MAVGQGRAWDGAHPESKKGIHMTPTIRRIAGYTAAVAAVAVVSTTAVQADFGHGHRGGRRGMMARGFGMRGLDLSDAQREQVKAVMGRHREAFQALAGRRSEARQQLHDAIASETIDERLIRERSAAVSVVEADGAVLKARVRSEVAQILTPEQRDKANAARERMGKRMTDRRNRMKERREKF